MTGDWLWMFAWSLLVDVIIMRERVNFEWMGLWIWVWMVDLRGEGSESGLDGLGYWVK